MNKSKRIFKAHVLCMAALLIMVSFSGCSSTKGDFDISGYVKAMLDSTYKGSDEEYINFTNATAEEASKNGDTTFLNATVRFFEKYKLNASETQTASLAKVFESAYAMCEYSVSEKVETSTGYDLSVSFTPMTTFKDISTRIESLKTEAGDSAYDVGASYIDKIIELCSNMLSSPGYGESVTQIIDIKLAENGDLSLNKNLFEKIDEEMLPF